MVKQNLATLTVIRGRISKSRQQTSFCTGDWICWDHVSQLQSYNIQYGEGVPDTSQIILGKDCKCLHENHYVWLHINTSRCVVSGVFTSSSCINNSCTVLPNLHVRLLKQEHKHARKLCSGSTENWYAWMHAATHIGRTPPPNTQKRISKHSAGFALCDSLCQRKMPSIIYDAWGRPSFTFLPIMTKLQWMALIFGI